MLIHEKGESELSFFRDSGGRGSVAGLVQSAKSYLAIYFGTHTTLTVIRFSIASCMLEV